MRRLVASLLSLLAVAALWELYKLIGPDQGWSLGATRLLPRTSDLAMPHVWAMVGRLFAPVSGGTGADVLWLAVLEAGALSLGIAAAGWAIGVAVGAVDGVEDRRDAALEAGQRLGEPHRVLLDALAEGGQHVLQHRGARAEQHLAVVAEVLPGQRVGAERERAGVGWGHVRRGLGWRHGPMVH